MKKGFIAIVACVFALSLALFGCAGSGSNADAKTAWAGTWDLHEMNDNGTTTSADDIELLRSLGLDVYLELNEDDTASLMLFGEEMSGTWEAKSTTEASVTLKNEAIDMTIQDGQLHMTQGEASLVFVKGEARTGSDASADAEASGSASAASSSAASWSGQASAGSKAEQVLAIEPVTLADDANALITVDAKKVDVDGDLGYVLNITNRTDRKVYVYSAAGWTVNGAAVDDPVLLQEVDAGATAEGFLWFDHEKLGISSLDGLAKVQGSIVVEGFDNGAKVAAYAFAM